MARREFCTTIKISSGRFFCQVFILNGSVAAILFYAISMLNQSFSSSLHSSIPRSSARLIRAAKGLGSSFCILPLTSVDETSRIEVRRLEGLQPLIALLSSTNEQVQANAAHALYQCALNGNI